MEFLKGWFQKSDSSKDRILRCSWCDEVAAWDEHTAAEIVFAQDCLEALRDWLKEHGPAGYQLILEDDPIRKIEPWIKGQLAWVDDHTATKLGTEASSWVSQNIWLEGDRLQFYRILSGAGQGALPETAWLSELAAKTNLPILEWKLGMGGYRPFSFPFSGSDSESLLAFLWRQQAWAVDGDRHNRQ